ncbi:MULTISPECIES: FmdB family zinc ribbon protein [unclassified Pseudoclavibacter]|uniref:FmdB family zinc ribbon protein n=1 Tax=unclassified Pseudoclavibacter TaxID=2615177 RepID=UPI001BA4CBBC|nr:zinc ribbon domain-containing protein [Pseudoclavibacter sp. Marseille-Q4354]MBS3179423.1 zinc ribbon domain-containing protein [Pseudoclavibacter sp. Marseille-Q4354]
MILYDFRCQEGHRFEAGIESMLADNPVCPGCGTPTSRVPSAVRIGGAADAGPSRAEMPHSWQGIDRGRPEAVAHWRSKIEKREKLEAKYPELAGDRRPILAHEGIFQGRPLRAGDDIDASVASATAAAATLTQEPHASTPSTPTRRGTGA